MIVVMMSHFLCLMACPRYLIFITEYCLTLCLVRSRYLYLLVYQSSLFITYVKPQHCSIDLVSVQYCVVSNVQRHMPMPAIPMLLLLLAAPTWLWGRCVRHNSPPASYVMDLVFRRSDYHVSVDPVHPIHLCFGLPRFYSPGWYHLQSLSSDVVLVSPLDVANPPRSRFPAPLLSTLRLFLI